VSVASAGNPSAGSKAASSPSAVPVSSPRHLRNLLKLLAARHHKETLATKLSEEDKNTISEALTETQDWTSRVQ
jgi:hypothetical protein